jgi:hypothetical protein
MRFTAFLLDHSPNLDACAERFTTANGGLADLQVIDTVINSLGRPATDLRPADLG